MRPKIVIKPNFMDEERCRRLMAIYDRWAHRGSQPSWNGTPVVHYWDISLDDRLYLAEAADRVQAVMAHELDIDPLYLESAYVAMMPEGGSHPPHSDNAEPNGRGDWQPNHTPQRCSSAMLYLNGDFDGGELYIKELDVVNNDDTTIIKPATGKLVMFPADWNFYHWTEPVGLGGKRYSCPFWFTQIRRFAMNPKERLHA